MISVLFLVLLIPVFAAGPVVSDNGNFVIDAPFDQERLKDPRKVSTRPLTGILLADRE